MADHGGFLTPLHLEDIDGAHWTLLTPLIYRSAAKQLYVVPAGFTTDLASIPRGLWNLIPKTGKHDRAGVLHDWLCLHPGTLTQAQVDGLFREALEACGVGWLTRQIMWAAVRIRGRVRGLAPT